MSRSTERVWKAVPLPTSFHAALDLGDWQRALQLYQRHPYHAPPADTYDLLTAVMHATGVRAADVKARFGEKVRLTAVAQRKAPEEVEWGVFWAALNRGDGRTISAAVTGARVSSVAQQIAVAEACAVLLRASGARWEERLVESVPFATVTRANLVHIALELRRPDVAAELLRNMRVTRAEMGALWPLMAPFSWEQVLQLVSACPKSSVPFDEALPFILDRGCDLQRLSEHLEAARVLGDVDVVAPLLRYAAEHGDWDYVRRCVEHLEDIGQVTAPARAAFERLCVLHTPEAVYAKLQSHHVPLHEITIERLENLKF